MGRRRGKYCRIWGKLALLVALVSVFELSGIAHAAADFLVVVVANGQHVSDCEDESGRGCDPGCSGCHCAHGGPTVAVAQREPCDRVPLTGQLASPSASSLRAPGPERTPPLRPPRSV